MQKQLTLAILKPSVFLSQNSTKQLQTITNAIEKSNLKIVARKKMTLTEEKVALFYKEHEGKFFEKKLKESMTRGPIEVFCLEGENAISKWRELMGPTLREKNISLPNTLRGQFATSDTRNAVHGSDSIQNAKKELLFFFEKNELSQNISDPTVSALLD